MSPSPNTPVTSITATDNPSTTTAFMLGEIKGELKSLNEKFTSAMTEINDLRNFRLKMYLFVGAISTVLNVPAVAVILGKF